MPDFDFLGPMNFPGPNSFPGQFEYGYTDETVTPSPRHYYLRRGRRYVR